MVKNIAVDIRLIFTAFFINSASAQLNLGSFNLFRNPSGDLQLGLGQGGSLFGYGADRALQVTVGPGRFGTKTDGGVVLGGERVGVDSQLGVSEQQGLNLGSLLRLGNNGGVATDPLGAMLRNIGAFLRLPPGSTRPTQPGVGGTGFLPAFGRPPNAGGRPPVGPVLPPFNRGGPSGGEGEIPLSVGPGWDGEDGGDIGQGGSGETSTTSGEEIEEISGPLTARRILPPATGVARPDPRPDSRVTTEGKRRGGTSDGNSGEGRHDGGTGEFERKGKLPVPDGLEMISAISGESRKKHFYKK